MVALADPLYWWISVVFHVNSFLIYKRSALNSRILVSNEFGFLKLNFIKLS
jgi:hypothetical protein